MLTPTAFRRLREYNGSLNMLTWLQYETKTHMEIPDEILLWLLGNHIIPDTFNFIKDKMSIAQIVNYVRKQMNDSNMQLREVIDTWQDYGNMFRI